MAQVMAGWEGRIQPRGVRRLRKSGIGVRERVDTEGSEIGSAVRAGGESGKKLRRSKKAGAGVPERCGTEGLERGSGVGAGEES